VQLATYAKYYISKIWTIFFNIKYPSLLTKEQPVQNCLKQPVLMAARNFHVISLPQIKCLTKNWSPHFSCS